MIVPKIFNRFGNKREILNKFINYLPPLTGVSLFIDLFCGTGCVSFALLERSKNKRISMILNDKDDKLIRFFEFLQTNHERINEMLKYRFIGSERVMNCKNEEDELIKWYLKNQKTTNFLNAQQFGYQVDYFANLLHENNVEFLNYDYKRLLARVPAVVNRKNEKCFIYMDPPYFNTNGDQYNGIDLDEFIYELKNLENLPGVTLFLNINFHEKLHEALKNWYSKELTALKPTQLRKPRIEMIYSNRKFINYYYRSIFDFC